MSRLLATAVAAAALLGVLAPAGVSSTAAGARLSVRAPSTATAGTPFNVTVTVLNKRGRPNTAFTGAVTLTTSDKKGVVPRRYTFAKRDKGRHVFKGVVLKTAATQQVNAATVKAPKLKGQASVKVSAGALDHLDVSPSSAAIAPPAPTGGYADYTALEAVSQSYTAAGYDAYGNYIGDVTAATTFSVSPDGDCVQTDCSGAAPGEHTVNAADGAAMGSALLTVDPYATAYDMTCQGQHYDVDGDLTNGCEQTPPHASATTQAAAYSAGSFPCADNASNPNLTGFILSDARTHTNPAVTGFDSAVGSAPMWAKITATGGATCADDISLTFTTIGGGNTPCYRLTVYTDKGAYTSPIVSGQGSTGITQGSGSYSDGSTIYFKVEKTCALPTQESVGYSVTGHL